MLLSRTTLSESTDAHLPNSVFLETRKSRMAQFLFKIHSKLGVLFFVGARPWTGIKKHKQIKI
jgi:hypothetical protein